MSTYVAELPNTTVDPAVPKFFEKFYAVSDNPSEAAHEEYARSFTNNATFVMGVKQAEGYDAVLGIRKGLWGGPIVTRLHTLKKIFPFGENTNEYMLYGQVKYGLKNGKHVTVDWAGRALMEDVPKKGLKMAFYQVYIDTSPVAEALKDS